MASRFPPAGPPVTVSYDPRMIMMSLSTWLERSWHGLGHVAVTVTRRNLPVVTELEAGPGFTGKLGINVWSPGQADTHSRPGLLGICNFKFTALRLARLSK